MLDALTLDQLRVFVAVAEAASFRGAARRLERAQSAISIAIANLEVQLGVSLFDRTTRRVSLSREGATLLEDAKVLIAKAEALRARGKGMGQGLEITITLATDPFLPTELVAQALANLHTKHPSVFVKVLEGPLGDPLEAVWSRRAEIGLTLSDELRDPRLEIELLGSIWLISVAAPHHQLARISEERLLTKADLADHVTIVVMDPSERTKERVLGVHSPKTWRVESLSMKAALLCEGVGWGTLPLHMAKPLIETGRLAVVAPAEYGKTGLSPLPAYLTRRSDTPIGPAGEILTEALMTAAKHYLSNVTP